MIEKPIPFDFLINGEFLRTSIQKYLQAKNISSVKLFFFSFIFFKKNRFI